MGISTTACSGKHRLAKATLLAMTGTKTFFRVGERVFYTEDNGRTEEYRVDKLQGQQIVISNARQSLTVPQARLTSASTPQTFLNKVATDNWSINSFDSSSGEACVTVRRINDQSQIVYTLPHKTPTGANGF